MALQHKDRNGESLKRALLLNPQVLQHMQVYRSQTHKSNRTEVPPRLLFLTSGSELHILSLEAVSALVKDWSSANLLGGAASAFPCALHRPIQQYHVSGKSFPFSFPFRAWTALDKNVYYRQFSLCFSLFWTALYNILHTSHNSNPSPAAMRKPGIFKEYRAFFMPALCCFPLSFPLSPGNVL